MEVRKCNVKEEDPGIDGSITNTFILIKIMPYIWYFRTDIYIYTKNMELRG
jgi:hypothetical protein